MLGFPETDASRGGLTRRRLLRNGVAGVAAVYGATPLTGRASGTRRPPRPPSRMKKSLVIIYLKGGNDVPQHVRADGGDTSTASTSRSGRRSPAACPRTPRASARRCSTRPSTAARTPMAWPSPTRSSPARASARTGTPRASTPCTRRRATWLVFPAADYNPSNQSHFEAATTGSPARSAPCPRAGSGAGSTPTARRPNPLQAISLDTSLSKQIRSSKAPVCALDGLDGVRFEVPNVGMDVADPTQVRKLVARPGGHRQRRAAARQAASTA